MRDRIPLLSGQSTHKHAKIKDEQTINWRPKVETPDALSQITLQYVGGLTKVTTVGTGPGRANMVRWGGALYGISGNEFFKMTAGETVTSIGTLNTSSGWCTIKAGRTYIAIVDGTNGYTYDGTTFAQITDVDFQNGATHISYLDGYFIVNSPNSDQFYISASEDPTTWSALDFASAEANPDNILALDATEKDLYLFGSETVQIFYNSGNATFPFDPYPNTLEYGIEAKYSLARSESGFYFLAIAPTGALTIAGLTGFTIRPIIDDDEAATINALTTTTDAIGAVYSADGVEYYNITFPSEDLTFEVNLKTGMMNRLKSYGIGRSIRIGYGSLGTSRYVMDYNNAKLYKLDFSVYTEDGGVIERYRRAQVIHKSGLRIQYNEIWLEIVSGVGNATNNAPIMQLRYSDDGGNNWSSWLDQSMGAVGEYYQKLVWRKLGESRGRTFEFRCTDPNEATIIDAYADVEVLKV